MGDEIKFEKAGKFYLQHDIFLQPKPHMFLQPATWLEFYAHEFLFESVATN